MPHPPISHDRSLLAQPSNSDNDAQGKTDDRVEAKPGDEKVVDSKAYHHADASDNL